MKRLARFVLVIVLVALFVRTEISYGVAVALLVLFVMTSVLPRLGLRRLATSRTQPDRVFHGESVVVGLTVENRGPSPVPWLEVADRAPLDLTAQGEGSERRHVISLGPGETKLIEYRLAAARRGYHRIGPAALEAGDWFGAFRSNPPDIGGQPLIVYPKIVPLEAGNLPARAPYASLRQPMSLQRDPSRIIGVREYQPGDPLRAIHWPASAATGTTLVKQYEPADARDLILSVDLGRNGYPQSRRFVGPELGITAAASLAHHAVTVVDQPVGLYLRGLDASSGTITEVYLPPRRTRAHLMLILEMLARFQTVPRLDFPAALSQAAGRFPWAATLVVCVGDTRPELGAALHELRSRGIAPAAVVTGSVTNPLPPGIVKSIVSRERDIRKL